MPYCEITIPKNYLSKEKECILSDKLTEILLDIEGLNDNDKSRSITVIDFKNETTQYIGGVYKNEYKVAIKIFLFKNVLNLDIKRQLFKDITEAFMLIDSETQKKQGSNIWCILMPVDDNNFSVGGLPITLDITRNFTNSL